MVPAAHLCPPPASKCAKRSRLRCRHLLRQQRQRECRSWTFSLHVLTATTSGSQLGQPSSHLLTTNRWRMHSLLSRPQDEPHVVSSRLAPLAHPLVLLNVDHRITLTHLLHTRHPRARQKVSKLTVQQFLRLRTTSWPSRPPTMTRKRQCTRLDLVHRARPRSSELTQPFCRRSHLAFLFLRTTQALTHVEHRVDTLFSLDNSSASYSNLY